MIVRIGIDLRWLQRAHHNSPEGALGGVGIVIENLWRGLAAASSDVKPVGLLHRGPVPPRMREILDLVPNAEYHAVGMQGLRPLLVRTGRVRNFLRLIESEAPGILPLNPLNLDVLHMTDQTPPPRYFSGPSVVTLHALFTSITREGRVSRHLYCGFRRATRVVAVSRAVASEYVTHADVRRERVSVIHNGIDLDIFKPQKSADALNPRFKIPGPYLLHVGVLTSVKNPEGLIAALGRLKRSGSCPYLVSTGPYQTLPQFLRLVNKLAREHDVADKVIVFDRGCAPEELAPLYRGALGLVFPSLEEGFGLPVIESLACGVPCVVSRVGGVPEVAGDLGIYVDPHDAEGIATGIRQLIADTGHRQRVAEQGPIRAREFSMQAMAANYLAVYREVSKKGE